MITIQARLLYGWNSITVNPLDTVQLPPFPEIVLEGMVSENVPDGTSVLVSPSDTHTNVFIAGKTLNTIYNNRVLVWVINPTSSIVTIKSSDTAAVVDRDVTFPSEHHHTAAQWKSLSALQKTETGVQPIDFDLSQSDISQDEREVFKAMLQNNRSAFAVELGELGACSLAPMRIDLEPGSQPVML